jgi:hypothetical protein
MFGGGRKLWDAKDDQAWVHDRFEEMNLHDERYEVIAQSLYSDLLVSFLPLNRSHECKKLVRISGCQEVVLRVVVVEVSHGVVVVALLEVEGTAITIKMTTPKTLHQKLSEGEALDAMKLLQETIESLWDPNENSE